MGDSRALGLENLEEGYQYAVVGDVNAAHWGLGGPGCPCTTEDRRETM